MKQDRFLNKLLRILQRSLIFGILILLSILLILAFVDISIEIRELILQPPKYMISTYGLMELLSSFLIILIGIELIETVKAYLNEDVVHVELVILVAIIALARKVIVWDFSKQDYRELISLAVMIVALGLTYFLVRRSDLPFFIRGKGKKNNNSDDSIS